MKKGMIAVISAMLGAGATAVAVQKKRVQDVEAKKELSDKHLKMFKMMDRWVEIKQEGRNLAEYFVENGYQKVIVYGMHYTGKRLVEELKNTNIQVVCVIDKKAQSIFADIDVITKDDLIPETDVIVVTAISFFDEIENEMKDKVDCPIVSLEDVVYEL